MQFLLFFIFALLSCSSALPSQASQQVHPLLYDDLSLPTHPSVAGINGLQVQHSREWLIQHPKPFQGRYRRPEVLTGSERTPNVAEEDGAEFHAGGRTHEETLPARRRQAEWVTDTSGWRAEERGFDKGAAAAAEMGKGGERERVIEEALGWWLDDPEFYNEAVATNGDEERDSKEEEEEESFVRKLLRRAAAGGGGGSWSWSSEELC